MKDILSLHMFGIQGGKPIHALGIDIGQSAIKVVQLRLETERIHLETYGEIALGPYAGFEPGQAAELGDEKAIEAIEDLLKAAKVTSRNAVISIESPSSFISMIEVPNLSDEELRTMMPLEARKYLPIPVSEVQLDFWRMPMHGEQGSTARKTNVVMAAVKNATLEKYSRFVTKLGLEQPIFEIESFSLVRSCLRGDSKINLIVDIGSLYTTVTLVEAGTILDLHVISHGSLKSTMQLSQALSIPISASEEAKRTFGYFGDDSNPFLKEVMTLSSYPLFGEIARLLLMYERKYNQVIEGVILAGGGARTPGILEAIKESVPLPVRIATPFDQVEVPSFLKEMITTVGPSYTVAVGLALRKLQNF